MNSHALIIGPSPPAIGGIATIVGSLQKEFADQVGVTFIDTHKNVSASLASKLLRTVRLTITVCLTGLKIKNCSVLIFSSAYGSFWEKCLWCLACKLLGLNTVLQMVDGNFPHFHENLPNSLKWLSLLAVKNIDTLAVQSPQWKIFYEKIFPYTHVRIVSPGIDTDFFVPRSTSSISRESIEIIYVGWLTEDKGIYDLLDAAQIVAGNGFLFQLRLIGPDFGNKNKINAYVERLGLESKIKITGAVTSRETLRETYQSADIFVFPSHFEGFPYALMEAISSGLPCIATRVGGIPDILDDGFCGLLIEKGSKIQLAESLTTLISDKLYRTKLGNLARKRAVSEYSLLKSLNDFKAVLNITNEG